MLSNRKAVAISSFVVATLLASAPGSALIIGAPATGGNFIPFGSIAGWPEYQQVYASSDFSGTVKIGDLEFYTVPGGTGSPNPGVYQISLSTTSAPVNALSMNLPANIGSNNTQVYDAKLPAVQQGVLTIPLSTPFTYNPADGNLLVDLVSVTPYTGGPAFEFNGLAGSLFSRAYSGMTIPIANHSGLVTGFTVVPEPATWVLMVLGFAGLGFAGFRAARRSVVTA
jgi:hypothetical protein